jgi:putative hemolysin
MNKTLYLIILLVALPGLASCAAQSQPAAPPTSLAQIANPASTFCIEKGGKLNIITDASGGQIGICVMPDGSQCEEWAFFRGECVPGKASTATARLTLDALKNAEYQSEFPASKKAKLTDGKYEETGPSGGASDRVLITLAPVNAFGDLNGDGVDDAAVVLVSNTGGSGVFEHLAAVINQNGTPRHVASEFLGDRVKIEAISIEAGVITVDMVTQGPQDPLCCPTQKVKQSYKLQGDKLVKVN